MHKVIVIGGGASGMFAAISASNNGNEVVLLEKNEKLGKKIYITGKGRCNLSNAVPNSDFINNVVRNPKFIYSAISELNPFDTIDFFENNGLKLKTERGNRVFPVSDKASDVTKTLEKVLKNSGVDIKLNTKVLSLIFENGKIKGVKTDKTDFISCDAVIICTGGKSYPLTGSDGDGYIFAKKTGHTITALKPSLCGIETVENDYIDLQGLSLKNVELTTFIDGKECIKEFGEMLFTHYGISGPIVLTTSSLINNYDSKNITFSIDLKPALDYKTLDNRLVREFSENSVKTVFNTMRSLLPQTLIPCVLKRAKIEFNKKCGEITKMDRANIIVILKSFSFSYKRLRSFDEAIITAGGVSVNNISPKTMESKIVKGLFFAGEVLDVDAFTGGFNLQIAFSTGFLAGKNA